MAFCTNTVCLFIDIQYPGHCRTQSAFLQGDAQVAQYVKDSGFLKPVHKITIADIPNIVQAVCTEYLITKAYAEILKFKEGLSVLGVSGLIEKYPKDLP